MWDEGWSGRFVHACGWSDDDPPVRNFTVVGQDETRPMLWLVEAGETIPLYRDRKVGF